MGFNIHKDVNGCNYIPICYFGYSYYWELKKDLMGFNIHKDVNGCNYIPICYFGYSYYWK